MGKVSLKVRVISLILSIATMVQFFAPAIVLAYNATEITNTKEKVVESKVTNLENEVTDKVKSPGKIVKELEEKRESNVKYFMMDDLTYAASLYSYDVHYMKNGKYVDINNKLEAKQAIEDSLAKSYENSDNLFKVKFLETPKNKYMYTFKQEDYEFSYNLLGVDKNIKALKTKVANDDDLTTLENTFDELTYKNIYDGVDASYLVMPNGIKENIILNRKTNIDKFTYEISTKNLELTIEDNVIYFINSKTKEIVYLLTAPYMYDAKNEINSDIKLSLSKKGNKYIIDMKVSSTWLNDSERKYPIVIDPIVSSNINRTNISDAHVSEGLSTSNYGSSYIIKTGYGSSSKRNRSFIKFNTLPTLQSGDMIINAYFQTGLATYFVTNHQVTIHKVNSSWNPSTITWNNQPAHNTKVVDYKTITGSQYSFQTWNITAIAKEWYSTGVNNGLMIKNANESSNYTEYYSSDVSDAYAAYRPVAVFQYVNYTGIENHWTYHTQSAGRAGSIYTNDYNGNLILKHYDASTPGNRLPAVISHVYNTNDANDINNLPINIGYGNGYRLNFSQVITSETIGGTHYYKYIDEDGTRQYFYNNGTTYIDENGLGLTLSLANNILTMKDKGGNTSTFEPYNSTWRLKTIKDTNNNAITINYNGNYISSVVDATGDILTLNYTNNLLSSIVDSSNKTTTYTYTNSNLTTITYPDNYVSTYTYDSNKLLTSAKNIDNSHIDYEYYTTKPYRVKTIKEYSTTNQLGKSLTISYGENTTNFVDNTLASNTYVFSNSGQTTSIVDYGKSGNLNDAFGQNYSYGTSGNQKNKLTLETKLSNSVINNLLNGNAEYSSNWNAFNWGTNLGVAEYSSDFAYFGLRSIKVTSTFANSVFPFSKQNVSLTPGKTYTYSAYTKTNAVSNQGLNYGAVLFYYYTNTSGNTVVNYSKGISSTTDWTKQTLTFVYPSDIVGNLNIALGVRDSSGVAYFDGVQLEEGKISNNYNLIENGNFSLSTSRWGYSTNLNTAVDTAISVDNNSVLRITGNPTQYRYYSHSTKMSGKKGDIYSTSAFAKAFGVPYYDSRAIDIKIEITNNDNTLQSIIVPISSDSNSWQYISKEFITEKDYKDIIIYLIIYKNYNEVYFDNITLHKDESGNSYAYDGNGNLVSAKDSANQNDLSSYDSKSQLVSSILPSGMKFNYEYDYNYTNRLLSATNKEGLALSLSYDTYGNVTNTKISEKSISTTIDTSKTYYIKSVASNLYVGVNGSVNTNGSNVELAAININGNQEWKFIDLGAGYYNIKPARATVNTFMEVTSASTANSANIQIWLNHNGNHEKFKLVKNDDGSYSFKPKHIETSCMDIGGSKFLPGTNITQFQCHGGSNQKFYLIEKDLANKKYIESSQQYSANGDYLVKEIDALGNEVTYTYNANGTVSTIKDSKNNITNYNYDTFGRLTGVSKMSGSLNYTNSYTYDKDKLSSITHNGFNYNFVYDTFGNTKQVKVGAATLVTNNYLSNNGMLSSVVYGNNDTISYEYDRFDRISKTITGDNVYEYTYDARGNLAIYKDNNVSTSYIYDLGNRLIRIEGTDNFKINYKYGTKGLISDSTYVLSNKTNSVVYNYDDNAKISNITFGGANLAYNYDSLLRVNNKTLTKGSNNYQTNYVYNTNGNKTSLVLDEMINGTNAIKYTYDANGNIETILENNVEKAKYYYDELNQLIKEDNVYLNKTITYTYDLGGNITLKSEYEYKTTNLLNSITYEYNNAWKDQLTKYDNKEITYDEIGNPLTYDGNTYEWINGRQLSKITKDTNIYQYKYNDSGIRTSKEINGIITKYYLEGSKIIYEQKGTNTIYYIYDESNNIIGLKYNEEEYYYIKNGQNDIIGILDSNLNEVVRYQYDSYGKVISIIDGNGIDISTNESHIGNINPYRYRSYYYDIETSLYYLNSRYYNSTWSRFINADGYVSTGTGTTSSNMFVYTENNFINRVDPTGNFWETILDVIGIGSSLKDLVFNSSWSNAGWFIADIGLAIIPFLPNTGLFRTSTKVIKSANKVDNVVDATKSGWKIGDNITDLTKAGNSPSWNTVKQRYWKNESFYNPNSYSVDNLARIKKGKAPLAIFEGNGIKYSIELHHIGGRNIPNPHNISNLQPLTPWDHSALDPFRFWKP